MYTGLYHTGKGRIAHRIFALIKQASAYDGYNPATFASFTFIVRVCFAGKYIRIFQITLFWCSAYMYKRYRCGDQFSTFNFVFIVFIVCVCGVCIGTYVLYKRVSHHYLLNWYRTHKYNCWHRVECRVCIFCVFFITSIIDIVKSIIIQSYQGYWYKF